MYKKLNLFFLCSLLIHQISYTQNSPPNDLCLAAIKLCPGIPVSGNNYNATWDRVSDPCNKSSNHNTCSGINSKEACFFMENSVWYLLTTNTTGGSVTITVTNIISCKDSAIGLQNNKGLQAMLLTFNGTACSNSTLTAVPVSPAVPGTGCRDNPSRNTNDLLLSASLGPNKNYYLVIDGAGDSINPVYCAFTVTLLPGNAVNECAAPPVAMFNINQDPKACVPYTFQFIDQSKNSPSKWKWDFGDPGSGVKNTDSIANPIHYYSKTGYYTVKLIAYNNFGKDDTSYINFIEIKPRPVINSISNDTVICAGEKVLLNASASGVGGVNYKWAPTYGLNDTTIINPLASPDTTVNYVLKVTDNTVYKCNTFDTVNIQVKNLKLMNKNNDRVICSPNKSVQLLSKGGNIYLWTPTNGLNLVNIATPVANPTKTTLYKISITDTNLNCKLNDTVIVYVSAPPSLASLSKDTFYCKGEGVQLQAGGVQDYNFYPEIGLQPYRWYPSAGLNRTDIVNPLAKITSEQLYYVDISNGLCVNTDSVRVYPLNIPLLVNSTEGCTPFSVYVFLNPNVSDNSITRWKWNIGDNRVIEQKYPGNIVYDKSGKYSISLEVNTINGCSDTFKLKEQIIVKPKPEIKYHIGPLKEEMPDPKINFINQTPNTKETLWRFGDGDSSNKPFLEHVYKDTGWYDVTLIVKAINSCSDTLFLRNHIYIESSLRLFIPTGFTPNGDGLNDLFYPIGMLAQKEFIYYIYNRWGNIVFSGGWDEVSHWNGTDFKTGKKVLPGVYAFVIAFLDKDDKPLIKSGTITVIY